MFNRSAKVVVPPAAIAPGVDDPRRTFESAIAHLQGGKNYSQTPIALRRRITAVGDPGNEKRVLNDAARALARLWNVSPALIR